MKWGVRICVALIVLSPVVALVVAAFKTEINTIDAQSLKRSGKGRH